jgi:hypothetical protein
MTNLNKYKMNKAEEFLLEEATDDLIMSCDSKGDYVYASDMMQKYADQQLILSGVSQQRELLQCFCNLANITHDTVNKDIEDTIYRFNAL